MRRCRSAAFQGDSCSPRQGQDLTLRDGRNIHSLAAGCLNVTFTTQEVSFQSTLQQQIES